MKGKQGIGLDYGDEVVQRIVVGFKPKEIDPFGESRKKEIENFLKIKVDSVKTRRVYTINADLSKDELDLLTEDLFVDHVTEDKSLDTEFDWLIEIGYKPGVTDNVGRTSKHTAIPDLIKRKLKDDEGVYTSIQYLISADGLNKKEIEKIASFFANSIIETIKIMSYDELKEKGISIELPVIKEEQKVNVKSYNLLVCGENLLEISKKGTLALNLEEMKCIKNYYQREDVFEQRKKIGMDNEFWKNPTDVELETLAQTWSEHCKHKIFNATIRYTDDEENKNETIKGLFNTYIKTPSKKVSKKYDWVLSSFHDNAGVVKFNEEIAVVDKVETHNAPSALEPYGGAITGIVGVNRDVMGTGIGAKPMFNVFGYCFGDPFYDKKLPEGVLHPKRIRDGVHKGVIDGGNQSGIPLVGGWEFFDERFTFRPLVYCGTIGVMPIIVNDTFSHIKKANPEDLIVMVGGRIGKDGIHGATFSSAELDKESSVQAVQIGDPITQKKMCDFLLEARDLGLYTCITDNGAGGLSSSVGEMAEYSGGCKIDLKKAPLKYKGLDPWEILLSEAQERMTVAVNKSKIDEFLELAKKRDVEATVLGQYENTSKFHATYGDRTVAYLDMEFLHHGLPKMKLNGHWKQILHDEPEFQIPKNLNETFEGMLKRINICSKENKLRQYDHEVKGLSVIKPLIGINSDTPSDATISFMEYGSMEGLIVAQGVNPHYSEIDTYHMATSVIDEAVRRIIAVGGSLPSKNTPLYGLDNFCWNISSFDSDAGAYSIAQLVRANKGLADYCMSFGIPCISGKDSMKNVWKTKEIIDSKEVKKIIPIPPTLLFSARAKMENITKAVTSDIKRAGDLVYIVGKTYDELGGSEYYSYMGEKLRDERYIGNNVPKVDFNSSKMIYSAMCKASQAEIIHSNHTPTIGGLGIALAESAFGGGLGIDIDLRKVPYSGKERDDYILFSESNSRFVNTIPQDNKEQIEKIMKDVECAQIGTVTEEKKIKVKGLSGECIIDAKLDHLKYVWKKQLGGDS